MKQHHPLTELIPVRADVNDLAFLIAQNGQQQPVILYTDMVIEGRVRQQACLSVGIQPQYRNWVMLDDCGDYPLDWMVRRHVEQHQPDELALIGLAAAVMSHYKALPGETHSRVARLVGLSQRRTRWIDWLQEAGQIGPVLSGEKSLYETSHALGFIPDRRTKALGQYYGKGDKFDESVAPLRRYLAAWKRKGYEFRHVNPREARRRMRILESLLAEVAAVNDDLSKRSVTATLSLPSERRVRVR